MNFSLSANMSGVCSTVTYVLLCNLYYAWGKACHSIASLLWPIKHFIVFYEQIRKINRNKTN